MTQPSPKLSKRKQPKPPPMPRVAQIGFHESYGDYIKPVKLTKERVTEITQSFAARWTF